MRGMARLISRSKNSHIRSPRNVTLAPMALPSRSLKPAIDFLARVTNGFWPVMTVRSDTACSSSDDWATAPPTPMLTTIFSTLGTSMTLPSPSCCCSAARISSLYRRLRRGTSGAVELWVVVSVIVTPSCDLGSGASAHPDLGAVGLNAVAHTGGPAVARAHHGDVAHRDRHVLVDDAARLGGRPGLAVAASGVHSFDDDLALARHRPQHHAFLAAVLAGEHDHPVAFLDLETAHWCTLLARSGTE